ncbi:hypothetical protein Q1695_005920 [Nippostrongylus brasiliensis]|nr:hypothetical protein Q1695_005920 [Nippostrongylus brasiliensis]
MLASTVFSLVAFLFIVRYSYQDSATTTNNFDRQRRNFFMSSGPSRARVKEMERLVNSIFPRRSRSFERNAIEVAAASPEIQLDDTESSQPCFCPPFSPCAGRCLRAFRYW